MAAFFLLALCGHAEAASLSVIRDEEIEHTLGVFARPIFEEAGLSPENVTFILVQNEDLNAFVAGGQNIFVNTGLILQTSGPEELFGVIAHETGHISSGHLFRTQEAIEDLTIQTMLANIIGLAAAAGARSGEAGVAIGSAGSAIAMRMMLRHSRVQESAADQAGVRFLTGAQLPLSGFLSFMEKLSSQELLPESQQSEYVRTHPLTRDRVDFLENAIREKNDKGVTPPEWTKLHARMKAKLEGYLLPDRALQKTGSDPDTQYARAIATYRKGKSKEAVALLDPLIRAEPENAYFHELKGQILLEDGSADEALAPYTQAVKYAPKSGLIRASFGHALMETVSLHPENRKKAIDQLQRALTLEPRIASTHRLLAIGYGGEGQEGLSRLHLAEEALLRNQLPIAKKEARLAKSLLPANTAGNLRANDILDVIRKREKEKK